MKKLLSLCFLAPLITLAQTGMKFEHGLTWAQIQAKAKAENKYIFMDAYTTWCGPCTYMAKNIFPLEEVGKALNKNFINVKVQLDTTKNDNDEVKKWYQDGHNIMQQYKVNVFPTYLYFSPNGALVHRAVGSSTPDVFIAKAADAVNPEKQFYVLLNKYNNGKREPAFLKQLAMSAQDAYDMNMMATASKAYLATQTDLTTSENLQFLNKFTTSSRDAGFAVILNNMPAFDKAVGEGAANTKLVDILMREELYPKMARRNAEPIDWQELSASLTAKYPAVAKEVIANGKVFYYQNKQDWNNFQTAVVSYMKDYGHKVNPGQLNSFAWTVFENCKDMTCVKEALEWSKRSFKDIENPAFIDTYANILYKLGNKDEAIKWEEKAIALGGTYQETLEKMKKGEKTWND